MNPLLNALSYQITWFAAVIGAGYDHAWTGPLAMLGFASWQLSTSRFRAADLRLIALALCCGIAIDTALIQCGLIQFAAPLPSSNLAPVWVLSLWCAFALTLNHSLNILKTQPLWIAAGMGAVAAPLAYLAAARGWHAIRYPATPLLALSMLSAAWMIALPLLVHAARGWTATPRVPLWHLRRKPA